MDQNLYNCLTRPTDSPLWGDRIDNPNGHLYFRDNGAKVLAVAHLDYVLWSKPTQKGNTIYCPQLDDRLGAWVIMHLLPSMGVEVDILLTDLEEKGLSTGEWFEPPKHYNWMFQFDRRGTDVVTYQYGREKLLRKNGFKVGFGAFSDISSMEHLGCAGFNFGVGYYEQHTKGCHAKLSDTARMAAAFVRFFQKYENRHLKPQFARSSGNYGGLGSRKATSSKRKTFNSKLRDLFDGGSNQGFEPDGGLHSMFDFDPLNEWGFNKYEWADVAYLADSHGYLSVEGFIYDGGMEIWGGK